MKNLYEQLKRYSESDYYGFHMPGHKRRMGSFANPFSLDITEIPGFDDLHHPEGNGVLTQAQERAARLYASSETHFLVNGSTAGILSAVSACTKKGGKILAARNCHRSVYHGIALQNLEVVYTFPQQRPDLWINGSIYPQDVDRLLKKYSGIQAVVLTSPTYDGICSDVGQIARIVHERGIPLIVDQAHGAHFPFHEEFPQDAVSQGADIVIHSVHKTLPSLTQTALLHVNGGLVDRERLRMFLSVYQTSSPSYVLMASIDSCMDFLETRGGELFNRQIEVLKRFHQDCGELKRIQIMGRDVRDGIKVWDMDLSRLLCSVKNTPWSGELLGKRLFEDYHLQMEMSTATYTLGISSVADTGNAFERLKRALFELDAELDRACGNFWGAFPAEGESSFRNRNAFLRPQTGMPMGDALEQPTEAAALGSSLGRMAASFVYLYPPGIPLLAPGEIITEEALEVLREWKENGMEMQGLLGDGQISVLREP